MKKYRIKINKKIPRFVIIILAILIELMVVAISWYAISSCWQSKYNTDTFNCLDMSEDCGHFFKSIGIPTKLVCGSHVNHSAHAWLILFGFLEFESTSLTINLFTDNANYYHVYLKQDI